MRDSEILFLHSYIILFSYFYSYSFFPQFISFNNSVFVLFSSYFIPIVQCLYSFQTLFLLSLLDSLDFLYFDKSNSSRYQMLQMLITFVSIEKIYKAQLSFHYSILLRNGSITADTYA